MKNEIKRPVHITLKDQTELWSLIIFHLNLLATNLPMEIKMLPNRKKFSDEWLKENGFEDLINCILPQNEP